MASDLPVAALYAGVPGQAQAVEQLRATARSPVHAYLFVGPSGSGRSAAALGLAASLLCRFGGDGVCRDCRLALAGQHPDVVEIARTGASITVDAARQIVSLAARSPIEGYRQVHVLHEFHLVRDAAPMLLKTLEEPPPTTVFIVIADEVTPELVTIASRCVRIDFGPVPNADIVGALVGEGVEFETASLAATAAGGDLGRARLLAGDPGLTERRDAWYAVPGALDGTGTAVAMSVDRLRAMTDQALSFLAPRHAAEIAALDEQAQLTGERGGGRKELTDRQRRELRRHRADELRFGLVTLASAYRDRLSGDGPLPDPIPAVEAIGDISRTAQDLARNPNETLLLQALLLRLPAL